MKVEERVKEYLELSKKATKGPWKAGPELDWFDVYTDDNQRKIITDMCHRLNDADFIASSRDMGPKLAEALLVALNALGACRCNGEAKCNNCYALDHIEAIFGEKVE